MNPLHHMLKMELVEEVREIASKFNRAIYFLTIEKVLLSTK